MTNTFQKCQCISLAAAMHLFGTVQYQCWLHSTWLPWPYTLLLILCGICCCMNREMRMGTEGLIWHFGLHSLTDSFFFIFIARFSIIVFSFFFFYSLPSLLSTFSSFLFHSTVVPTMTSMWAQQIDSPGVYPFYSAATNASASMFHLLWPCYKLCSTRNFC